jgi:D-3-phosphoglycerate dehydrogenase
MMMIIAELVLAEIVVLARQLGDRNREIHEGIWSKVSSNCYEIRGKTLGKLMTIYIVLSLG